MTIINKVSSKSVMPGVTPIPDVVDAPTIGTATAGIESATVAYTEAATGGAATSFTAISTPGSITGTGSSPITVSGLTAGTAYTFKVYGSNASGTWSAVQSAASNSVTPTSTAFYSIATTTLSSAGTVTFSSIPQTYQHLQVRLLGRSVTSGTSYDGISMRINGVTSGNYACHYLVGDGATVSANGLTSRTDILSGDSIPRDGKLSNTFGVGIVDVHDYASTTKNKVVRLFSGYDANGTGHISLSSGMILNTSAVTSLTFLISGGTGYTAGSTFALYGIKGE